MTDLTEAARATRRYVILGWTGFPKIYDGHKNIEDAVAGPFKSRDAALKDCDRLNLVAVLEALREPSNEMATAAEKACGLWEGFLAEKAWRAMIDALIAEVGK